MKVLVACEFTSTVREAFKARGHDVWSCDLLPTDIPGQHIQGDCFGALALEDWDLIIAHPPCTYLSTVGNGWFKKQPERYKKRDDAFKFFMAIYHCAAKKVCIENPQGYVNTNFRKPDQTVHPYYFGEPVHKRTCFWLRGLPKLQYWAYDNLFEPRDSVDEPDFIHYDKNGRGKRWCDMLVRIPVKDRWKERSKTFQSIANAMANQWG